RYREILQNEPNNVDALYRLAQIACQQGDFTHGIDLGRKVLLVAPRDARGHNLIAMAYLASGRPDQALSNFNAAIACRGDLAAAHGGRGDALVALGRPSEAIGSYDRALELAPGSVENWVNRGAVLQEIGRYEDALESYERALLLEPDFAEVCAN